MNNVTANIIYYALDGQKIQLKTFYIFLGENWRLRLIGGDFSN